jgi:hypothetical protein
LLGTKLYLGIPWMPNIPFASIYRFHVKDEKDPYWRTIELQKAIEAKYRKDVQRKPGNLPPSYKLLCELTYNHSFTRLSSERLPK